MPNKILITGTAGFIGFSLAKSLLSEENEVFGIDNMDSYYDLNLKNNRLDMLNKFDNYTNYNIDISDYEELSNCMDENKPNIVVNLAAQVGVRNSISNPLDYINPNFVGFVNIIELSKIYGVHNFVYASSSSVYGGNQKIPFSENDRIDNPISLYAASKVSNELIAHSYSHLHGINTTGLRFFTVYGPWGRPDMAVYKFTDKIFSNKQIEVYNDGNMERDFTYIDDIVDGIKSAINKNYKCEVFNLGNNRKEKVIDLVRLIEKYLSSRAQIKFSSAPPGDMQITYADIEKSSKMLNYQPKTDLKVGIEKFIDWYTSYKKL